VNAHELMDRLAACDPEATVWIDDGSGSVEVDDVDSSNGDDVVIRGVSV
jgi:hypothetical protein